MSGYLNPEDEESHRLFYQSTSGYATSRGRTSGSSPYQGQQQWDPSPYQQLPAQSSSYSGQSFAAPSQYVSWPSTALPQLEPLSYNQSPYSSVATSLSPSASYAAETWPNAPWPALHPDDAEGLSETSRSTSPNPADLHNFGILLNDGRSWKCAYPGCTSQARFTRGCDLRKHYRRHTKTLFCRHEDCPQHTEGGFSSNKDLVSQPRLYSRGFL